MRERKRVTKRKRKSDTQNEIVEGVDFCRRDFDKSKK